jgi:hypothetical protein
MNQWKYKEWRLFFMNKLTIIYATWAKQKVINNPKFIPRIGELVDFEVSPAPTVKRILWKYETNEVFVIVD